MGGLGENLYIHIGQNTEWSTLQSIHLKGKGSNTTNLITTNTHLFAIVTFVCLDFFFLYFFQQYFTVTDFFFMIYDKYQKLYLEVGLLGLTISKVLREHAWGNSPYANIPSFLWTDSETYLTYFRLHKLHYIITSIKS